jgi:hypothetical protein
MILREFIYFNREKAGPQEDDRYVSQNDTDNILKRTDYRKTRLTLKMINDIRKASESHTREHREEMGLVRKMYAAPPPEEGAV